MSTTRPSHPAPPSRRRRDRRGAAAVEFALVMLPLLTLLLGTIQYGWYFFTSQSASSAARETARRLVVGDCDDTTASTTTAQTYARNQANVINLTLTYGTPDTSNTTDVTGAGVVPAVGSVLRVKVTAAGNIINFLPMPNGGQVTRVVNARVENDTPTGAC